MSEKMFLSCSSDWLGFFSEYRNMGYKQFSLEILRHYSITFSASIVWCLVILILLNVTSFFL